MMVPIKEMTDVMKVVKEVVSVKPKQWVRLKRGIYKDDLAQVCVCYVKVCRVIELGVVLVASHSECVKIHVCIGLVNTGFIIWLSGKFFLLDTAGILKQARYARIWFILSARRASHIMKIATP